MEPIRILLVDDNQDFIHTMVKYLARYACLSVVGIAHSGEQALTLAGQVHPQLVLMDVAMPGMGGLQAVQKLRERFPNTHVLMLTIHTQDTYRLAAQKAGADGLIAKTEVFNTLLVKIEALFARSFATTPETYMEKWQQIVEQSPVSVVITDTHANIRYVNPKFCQLTGYSAAELIGHNPRVLQSEQTSPEIYAHMWQALRTGQEWHGELCNKKKNGELYWEMAVLSPLFDASGQITHYLGIKEDITARKLAEIAESLHHQEMEALQVALNEIAGELDLDKLLYRITTTLVDLLGARQGALSLVDENHSALEIHVSYPPQEALNGVCIPLGHGGLGRAAQLRHSLRIDNYLTWEYRHELPPFTGPLTAMYVPLISPQDLLGVVVVEADPELRSFSAADVRLMELFARQAAVAIQNALLFGQVQHLAVTDFLTNLHNRRGFLEHAWIEFERARRSRSPLTLILFDIDHFKEINDTFGHANGDRVLQTIARVCKQNLRVFDIVGRYGGEEFLILLPDTSLEQAGKIADRLRQKVNQACTRLEGHTVQVTISLGVACTGQHTHDLETLIQQADQAMYQAKQSGRNRISFFCQERETPGSQKGQP